MNGTFAHYCHTRLLAKSLDVFETKTESERGRGGEWATRRGGDAATGCSVSIAPIVTDSSRPMYVFLRVPAYPRLRVVFPHSYLSASTGSRRAALSDGKIVDRKLIAIVTAATTSTSLAVA